MGRMRAILVTLALAITSVGVIALPEVHAVGGTISGVVTDTSGAPIVGATVRAVGDEFGFIRAAAVSTDSTGAYVIGGLAANVQPWRVAAGAVGFVPTFAGAYKFQDSQTFPVTADETYVVNFQLSQPTASVSGVITAPGGAPVAGATVTISRPSQPFFSDFTPAFDTTPFNKTGTTDANGAYTIAALAPGDVYVSAEPPATNRQLLLTYLGQIDVPPSPFTLHEGQAATAVDIELEAAATITGRITDPAGNPVRGASVIASGFPFPEQGSTDIDGNYEVTHLHPGVQGVFAFGPAGTNYLQTNYNGQVGVVVTAGQVLTGIDMALTPAARIVPTYFNSDGTPSTNTFAPSVACPQPALPVQIDGGVSGPVMSCDVGDPAPSGNYGTYTLIPTGPINFGVLGSGIVALDLAADDVVDCTVVYGGAITCVPGSPPPTDDGDSVPAAVEDAAPNQGDGNLDGVADSVQSNVASLPVAIGTGYLTATVGVPNLIGVINVNPTFGGTIASDVGQIYATILPAHYGDTVDVAFLKQSPWNADSLISGFFARPQDRLPDALVSFNGSTLTLHITDGGVGDDDNARNGSIQIVVIPVVSDSIPPTITCPTDNVLPIGTFEFLTATASDVGTGLAVVPGPAYVDTSFAHSGTVVFTAVDKGGNVTTVSCPYTVMDDGDGVAGTTEDSAPLRDGNHDGIRDAVQANVASSLVFPVGPFTLAAPSGTQLSNVSSSVSTPIAPPPGHTPVLGPLTVNVGGLVAGASTDLLLLALNSSAVDEVLSYDGAAWNVAPTTIAGTDVSVHLVDGGLGDSDGVADGTIRFVGGTFVGPVTPIDTAPPTVSCSAAPSFLLNQPNATLSARVDDSESGVSSATVTVTVSTSTVGPKSVVVSASDLAGNVGAAQCSYNIGVKLDRLISPPTGVTSVAKASRSIPVRWRAVDFNGAPVTDRNHFLGVDVTMSSCGRGRTEHIDSVRNRGMRYLGNGRWEYDVTMPSTRGCYSVRLNLTGASRAAPFRVN